MLYMHKLKWSRVGDINDNFVFDVKKELIGGQSGVREYIGPTCYMPVSINRTENRGNYVMFATKSAVTFIRRNHRI